MTKDSMNFGQWYPQARAALSGEPDADTILSQMIEDPGLWPAFLLYLQSGTVDPATQGSFITWAEGEGMPNPTLGELMDGGMGPMEAFLHLAGLAAEVNAKIDDLVGRYEAGEILLEEL